MTVSPWTIMVQLELERPDKLANARSTGHGLEVGVSPLVYQPETSAPIRALRRKVAYEARNVRFPQSLGTSILECTGQ